MPQFPFQTILLRQLQDNKGWEIIGIRPDCTREVITTFTKEVGVEEDGNLVEIMVVNLANRYARHLAGKPFAQLD